MLLEKSDGPHIKSDKNGRRTLLTNKPEVIEKRFIERLRSGIQTKYTGAFLIIPFLQQLDLDKHLPLLKIEKEFGIPVIKDFILAVNMSIIGKSRFGKLKNSIKDLGLATASGLPAYPDQSHMNNDFLDSPKISCSDDFIKAIGRHQIKLGYLDCAVLTWDTHLVKYNGKIDIQKDNIPQAGRACKAIRVYAVVDEGYRNPVYLSCGFPGNKATKVGKKLINSTLDILPDDKKSRFIFDKWFSVGELLNYIKNNNQDYITLIRRHKNRIQEMEDIPVKQFEKITDTLGITHIWVQLRNYEGKARLTVVELYNNGERKLLGYISNNKEIDDRQIVQEYSDHWDIEFSFDELNYLGLSDLPSPTLNKVRFSLAIKLIAYNAVSAFRANLDEQYIEHEVETIYDLFFDCQSIIKLKGEEIVVTIFDHPYEDELEPIYRNLSEKLKSNNINPRFSWLGNYPLKFEFR